MQVSTNNIIFLVILITCIFLIAGAFLLIYISLYNERKRKHFEEKKMMNREFEKQLLQSQLETQEETFQQISQELHDNVGQLLSSTKLLLVITERQLTVVPDTLRTAEETLSKAILDLRSFSKSLNKEWLEQFNLIENLRAETERINTARTINMKLTCTDSYLALKAESQIMLFRIIQEALQNTIKHSEAEQVAIDISQNTDNIIVSITDNGKGFNEKSLPAKGVGLMNMKHRTHLLGGVIEWISTFNQGTRVLISLPV